MREAYYSLTKFLFGILLLNPTLSFSQDCEPSMTSKDGSIEYFGGKIRDVVGVFTDDKSAYSFYIVQVNKGKDGTAAYVSFYESVDSKEAYNNSINNYLTEEKLKNSFLEIELNNETIRIPSTNCRLKPEKTLGDIYGYSVGFEGSILRSQVLLLQENDIKKFKIVLGGKPYERTFKKQTKVTDNLKSALKCVNLEYVYEVKKKLSSELNLDEVEEDEYSAKIAGKWLLQSDNTVVLEFTNDKIIVSKSGNVLSSGTYKISGLRLIYTGTTNSGSSNNGVSNFELFLKDMLILKEKGKEYTYERMNE